MKPSYNDVRHIARRALKKAGQRPQHNWIFNDRCQDGHRSLKIGVGTRLEHTRTVAQALEDAGFYVQITKRKHLAWHPMFGVPPNTPIDIHRIHVWVCKLDKQPRLMGEVVPTRNPRGSRTSNTGGGEIAGSSPAPNAKHYGKYGIFSTEDILRISRLLGLGMADTDVAMVYDCSSKTIGRIRRGETYQDFPRSG